MDLDLAAVARELGHGDIEGLRSQLSRLRTRPKLDIPVSRLLEGTGISREDWSSLKHQEPLFQRFASELGLGTPCGS